MAEALESRQLLSAQLLKDIDTIKPGADFLPAGFAAAGSVAYFADNDGVTGEELWKTDGTTSGTQLVKDIYAGGASSFPGYFTTIGSITYFNAGDLTDGSELWRTDGTAAGTYLVKDIYPGSGSSNPSDLTVYNGQLYFFATDGVHGRELWKSDGTSAGTVMVVDSEPGASGQASPQTGYHRLVVSSNNVLFFTAFDGTNNNLYTTTGAVGNATIVKTLAYFIEAPGLLANGNGLVFYNDVLGYIYQSDGTTAGTVTDDATNTSATNMTIAGNYLYYTRNGSLKVIVSGAVQTITSPITASAILGSSGSYVYFGQTSGSLQVWYTYYFNGIYSGLLVNNVTGVTGVAAGSSFYFVTGTSTIGYSLYKTATSGTQASIVTSINAGGTLSAPTDLTALGTKLLFINTDATHGTQPWVSDGTAAGTGVLDAVYPGTAGSFPFPLAVVNGRLVFNANDGVTGAELYATDGTTAGTVLLKDINPGAGSSSPENPFVVGTKLYFAAYDPTNLDSLWVTDGTAAGTSLVYSTGSSSAFVVPLAFVNGWLLFSANDSTHGTELWRTDGATANTQLVDDIYSGTGSSNPSKAVVLNGYAYFTAADATHGTELWRSDGTAAGTTLVDDIYPGSTSSSIGSLFVYNNLLLFSAQSSSSTGTELWESDGTAVGTVLVKDIYPGTSSSSPSGFTLYNGKVYFAAKDATTTGLWVTDGTNAGTTLIAEDNPVNLTAMNGKLYFIGEAAGQTTRNLYVSQGTAETTTIVSPSPTTFINGMVMIGGRLFFIADDGSGAGDELWSSDGTAAGTALVQDLFPGVLEGASTPLTNLNGSVIASGDNGVSGRELYEFPDIYPPELYAASASVAPAPYSISFSFSENVSGNLSASSLQLQDLTTAQAVTVSTTGYSYNTSTNTATFTLPQAALVDGRYRATLAASSLVDPSGNVATSDAVLEFLSVAGTSGNDNISIQPSSDGLSIQVFKSNSLTFTTPIAALGSVVVTGAAGDDSLSITLGSTLLPGGYSFAGGAGTNSLAIIGTSGSHTVSATAGVVTFDAVRASFANCASTTFDPGGGTDSFSVSALIKLASAPGAGRVFSFLDVAATLDANNNSLDLPAASLSTIYSLIQSGSNSGEWNGSGIDSSAAANDTQHLTALGILQNNQSGTALYSSSKLFAGIAPGAADILVKYTYYGDANLDGKVDGSDYTRIDSGFLTQATGWYNGDFNYDGVINGSDYTLIDNAFNTQGASLAAQLNHSSKASILVSAAAKPTASFFTDPSIPFASSAAVESGIASIIFADGDVDFSQKQLRFADQSLVQGG